HLRIDDFPFALKKFFARRNLHQHQRSLRERVHHVQIAAVHAQLADARSDAYVGSLFDQFRAGDKRIPGPTSSLFEVYVLLRLNKRNWADIPFSQDYADLPWSRRLSQ